MKMLLIKAVLLFGLFVLGIHSQNIGSFNSVCSQEVPKSALRPNMRFFGSGVIEDRYVVLLGGSYGKGTDQIWEYDLDANIWKVSGNTSFALGKFPSVVEKSSKKLLIVTSGSEHQENQVWEYSREKGLVPFKCVEPKLHLHLQGHSVAYSVEQDTLIMFGGRDMKTSLPSDLTYTFRMKGQDCNGWTLLPTGSNPSERTQHTSFFDDSTNLLHIFGGYDVNGNTLNDWWSLSLANMTWESHAAGSFPILESPAISVYDQIQKEFYHYGATVNIYDAEANTWKNGNGCGYTWGNGAVVSQSTLYTFKNSGGDLVMLSNRIHQERPDDQLGVFHKIIDDAESIPIYRRQENASTTGFDASTTGSESPPPDVKNVTIKHEATAFKLIYNPAGTQTVGNITLPDGATVQEILSTECAENITTDAELENCTLKFIPRADTKQFRAQLLVSLGNTTLNAQTAISFKLKWRSDLDNAQWWFDLVTFTAAGTDKYQLLGDSKDNESHQYVGDWHIFEKKILPGDKFADLLRVNDTDKSVYLQIRNFQTGSYDATVNLPFYVDTYEMNTCDSCTVPTEGKSSSPNWGLIGGLIGAFVVIVIIAILLVLFYRRRYIRKAYDRRSTQLTMEMKSMNIPEVKNVVVGRRMGAGNYGEVFEGTAWGGTTRVALKKLKKELMDEFLAEAAMLMKLKHPNCVLFLGIYNGISGDRFIVTEFCENGSLLDWLEKKRDQLSPHELLELAFGAATGMAYLAGSNIVHRDLSARNLLVDGSGTVKVADFGMSRAMESGDDFESIEGKFPIRWSAPEVIKSFKFSAKSDVWSMGVTLYEIITFGRVPYGGMSNQEVIEKVVDQGYRLPKPQDCPDRLWELVMKTWSFEPADRPTMQEIAQTIGALLGRQPARTVDQPPANPSGTFSVSTYADVSSVQTGSSSTYTGGPPQEPSTGHYDPTNTSIGSVSAVPQRTNNPPRGSSKYVDWGDNNNQSMEDDKKPEPEEENLYNNIARDQLMPPDDDAQKGKEEEESLYNA